LVREPYFNEAGYEVRAGSEESVVPSRIYSEKIYFLARGFVVFALRNGVSDLADVVKWLYIAEDEGAPGLLGKAIEAARGLVEAGESGKVYETGGLTGISKGALVMLKRQLGEMEKLREGSARHESLR
jgi:ubiquitin-conjugating enzyme E2 O